MQHPLRIIAATPVLRVADVGKSLAWYREMLDFDGAPFPEKPPHDFAILRHGECEIMLRKGASWATGKPCPHDWFIYVRLEGAKIRDLFALLSAKGIVTRRLERMFYGQAEFEITDPDGYAICIAEPLENMSDLPNPVE
jgi:uncharacterized glyoxalase superfamily protein PhnB